MATIQVNPLILKMRHITGRKQEMRCFKVDKTDTEIIAHYRKSGSFLKEVFNREEWIASTIVSDDPTPIVSAYNEPQTVGLPHIVVDLPTPKPEPKPAEAPQVQAPTSQTAAAVAAQNEDTDAMTPEELQLLRKEQTRVKRMPSLDEVLPGEYNARVELKKFIEKQGSMTGMDSPHMMQAQIEAEFAIQEGKRKALEAMMKRKQMMALMKTDG